MHVPPRTYDLCTEHRIRDGGVVGIDDPNCPSGKGEQRTETTVIETTTTVFRGTHQLGEPQTHTTSSTTVTTNCV